MGLEAYPQRLSRCVEVEEEYLSLEEAEMCKSAPFRKFFEGPNHCLMWNFELVNWEMVKKVNFSDENWEKDLH